MYRDQVHSRLNIGHVRLPDRDLEHSNSRGLFAISDYSYHLAAISSSILDKNSAQKLSVQSLID